MRLGLVQYVGKKIAPFEITKAGEKRLWSASRAQVGDPAQVQRWLPEGEAKSYAVLPDFTLLRWGRNVIRGNMVAPRPEAVPISVLLQAKQATAQVAAELQLEEAVESPFLLSTSGTVHVRGCVFEPTKPVAELFSMEEASSHPQFKKWHSCVKGV